jgi:hypothetical protein
MPRPGWLLALAGSIAITIEPASAAPQATIQSGWPPAFSFISKRCDGFAEDALSLIISENGKKVASDEFCSAYGEATATVVEDRAHTTYILVEYGEGRGSNATTKYLKLYRMDKSLSEIVRIPLSWATGPSERFAYNYRVEPTGPKGLRISLNGKSDPGSNCCVPSRHELTIDLGD